MRDRLIDLLDNITSNFRFTAWKNTDRIADYLLKNGIVVLPCPIGTKIYHLDLEIPEDEPQCSDCKNNHSGFGDFWCDENYFGWPSFEDLLSDPESVCPRFKPLVREETFTLSFWASYEKWFNKSWFLTEEEANKTLDKFK
jgi:hypothetical protein